ncbi:unnamed protein product, partial [Meganyctiphanes norvegica]
MDNEAYFYIAKTAFEIRPQIARELIEMCRVCTSVQPGDPQVWLGSDKGFTYDYVFDIGTQQNEVYANCVETLVEGCFSGYNATVLAYGQTGSGKTYTMGTGLEIDNDFEGYGIIPRAVDHLFNGINERIGTAKENGTTPPKFTVSAHFMELYNEEIIDLFEGNYSGGRTGIRIHEDCGGGIYVSGITSRTVSSMEETMACLRGGALSRTTASTNMNAQSSRSHAIFTLLVSQTRILEQDPDNIQENPESETLTAKFHFVDLAGSERLKRTGATGERAKEGISINCGLLALGNVISALGDSSKKVSHVPYRDSKLTRLLQDSLGGNSRTLMIACISPSDTDFMETLNTLKYANRARNIRNRVTVNQDKTSKTIQLLRQEIQQLQIELLEYQQGKRVVGEDGTVAVNDMFHENQMLFGESNNLRTRVKALQETIDMLTAKNTQLLAAQATGQWMQAGEDSDISSVVEGYLKEIEELRAKLMESENLCAQLRKQLNNRTNRFSVSPMHGVTMTGSMYESKMEESTQSFAELIEEAKKDLTKDLEAVEEKKKKLFDGEGSGDEENEEDNERNDEEDVDGNEGDDDADSSDESGEDKENYSEELADITSEISIKQKLIEGLEQSQRRLETMKQQYEDKLNTLMTRIRATQDERDKVLTNIKQGKNNDNDRSKTIKAEYEKKITTMQQELKKLQAAQKEHARLMRERTQHERQLRTLKGDLNEMKKTKVKLMNKMKEDNNQAKHEQMRRNKEIAQLRKASRKQETTIRNLEAENRLKNQVLKRKTEELAVLKKVPKSGLSNKAAGRLRKKVGIG